MECDVRDQSMYRLSLTYYICRRDLDVEDPVSVLRAVVPVLVVQLRCVHTNYSSLFHLLNMAEDVQNDLCHHSVHQLQNTHRSL
jgi:hypothetical protein